MDAFAQRMPTATALDALLPYIVQHKNPKVCRPSDSSYTYKPLIDPRFSLAWH